MQTEILDIVNEADEVIGTATKAECHAHGHWHRSVFIFVFDAAGRLLLQQRSAKKDIRPGKITASACGHVLSGESVEAAAARELAEELGLTAPLTFVLKTKGPYTDDREIISLFTARADGEIQMQQDEIDAILPMTLQEVAVSLQEDRHNWGATFRQVFADYVALLG